MAQQSVPQGTWDEDPDGASILLATGRARHDLLVIAEPAFLRDLDQVWGRPSARVRLSFLPGVHAPSAPGQEDALMSYERGGLGVLVARGRTSLYEGESVRSTTALARIASGARLRAALLVTRATPLRGSGDVAGGAAPGQVRVVSDHLNLSGGPLFQATGMVSASWDANLTERLGRLRGVSGSAVAALVPGPLRPSHGGRRRRHRLRCRGHGTGLPRRVRLRPDLPRRPGRRREPRTGAALLAAGLRCRPGGRRRGSQKPAGR